MTDLKTDKMLAGQTIFLSGCGDGLGSVTARLFASQGANLIVSARKDDVILPLAKDIEAEFGTACLPLMCNIVDADACAAAVQAAQARFGRIDALINIAHRNVWPRLTTLLNAERDLSDWRPPFEVNVFGTLIMTRAVAEAMVAAGNGGRIVMINTMTAEKVYEGSEAYSGSKMALQRMTRSVAMELGPYGIRVNSMHPGWMGGPQTEKVFANRAEVNGTSADEEKKKVIDQTALKYLPTLSEYARVLLFFVSPLSDAITGQSLHVNAGMHMN